MDRPHPQPVSSFQAEIVKRLSGICAQIIPFLTQEVRGTCRMRGGETRTFPLLSAWAMSSGADLPTPSPGPGVGLLGEVGGASSWGLECVWNLEKVLEAALAVCPSCKAGRRGGMCSGLPGASDRSCLKAGR